MSPWLSRDELFERTLRKQNAAIRRALDRLKIKYTAREDDGFPLVERAQFQHVKGYNRRRTPNWAALDGV